MRNDPEQRLANRFIWFKKWILERQTFKTLSRDSKLSIDTLQRIFYTYLEKSPTVKIVKRDQVHLRMDATYFKRFCLVCYQDHEDGYTQLIRFSNGEHFDEIKEDLSNLIKLGVKIESITTDGHKSILKAIKKSLPDALSQRCLAKHLAGMELRWLVLQLLDIRSDNDRLHWTQQLRLWYERHKDYLQEKTYNEQTGRYWYTHKLWNASLKGHLSTFKSKLFGITGTRLRSFMTTASRASTRTLSSSKALIIFYRSFCRLECVQLHFIIRLRSLNA